MLDGIEEEKPLLLLLLLLWHVGALELLRPGRARLWATAPLDVGFRV